MPNTLKILPALVLWMLKVMFCPLAIDVTAHIPDLSVLIPNTPHSTRGEFVQSAHQLSLFFHSCQRVPANLLLLPSGFPGRSHRTQRSVSNLSNTTARDRTSKDTAAPDQGRADFAFVRVQEYSLCSAYLGFRAMGL